MICLRSTSGAVHAFVLAALKFCCLIVERADLNTGMIDSMEGTNHVTVDIRIMCSCLCHIPPTLKVLLGYIN